MPINTHTDSHTRLVVHTVVGEISLDDVRGAIEGQVGEFIVGPGMRALWDFGRAQLADLRLDEVKRLAEVARSDPSGSEEHFERIAVVAPGSMGADGLHEVLTRTHRIWSESYDGEFRAFLDKTEALTWLLREDEDVPPEN